MNQTLTKENDMSLQDAGAESRGRPFKEVAETGLRSLREFAANPDGFMNSDKGREFRDMAETSFAEAKEKFKTLVRDGEVYVRENPTKAVLAAVGVGFVLGVLLKR